MADGHRHESVLDWGQMKISTGTPGKPKRECLGTDEIIVAFGDLETDEKLKLAAIEMHLLSGTGFSKGEIVQEAVCRAVLGQRKCPRDVPLMAFLVETMKSIAFHERRKRRSFVTVVETMAENLAEEGGADCASSPEEELISAEEVQRILDHFDDDEQAMMVLMGIADGLRGKDLREVAGLDQAGLDYTIRRIRNRMRKLYPSGWNS